MLSRWEEIQITIPLASGSRIPVFGHEYRIRPAEGDGRSVWAEGHTLFVPGGEGLSGARIKRWLKKQAAVELARRTHKIAEKLGKKAKKVTVRVMHSRWGSCSSEGEISYSWRLVFAPLEVVNYLVCHEVAHLKHMHHGPRFWAVVKELCPGYERHREWLSQHGKELYRYG